MARDRVTERAEARSNNAPYAWPPLGAAMPAIEPPSLDFPVAALQAAADRPLEAESTSVPRPSLLEAPPSASLAAAPWTLLSAPVEHASWLRAHDEPAASASPPPDATTDSDGLAAEEFARAGTLGAPSPAVADVRHATGSPPGRRARSPARQKWLRTRKPSRIFSATNDVRNDSHSSSAMLRRWGREERGRSGRDGAEGPASGRV